MFGTSAARESGSEAWDRRDSCRYLSSLTHSGISPGGPGESKGIFIFNFFFNLLSSSVSSDGIIPTRWRVWQAEVVCYMLNRSSVELVRWWLCFTAWPRPSCVHLSQSDSVSKGTSTRLGKWFSSKSHFKVSPTKAVHVNVYTTHNLNQTGNVGLGESGGIFKPCWNRNH